MKICKDSSNIVRIRWSHLLIQASVINNHSIFHFWFCAGRVINSGVHLFIRVLGDKENRGSDFRVGDWDNISLLQIFIHKVIETCFQFGAEVVWLGMESVVIFKHLQVEHKSLEHVAVGFIIAEDAGCVLVDDTVQLLSANSLHVGVLAVVRT